jgi:DNA adenine methylase
MNYENIINESGKDVFIYVDPPYYVNTLLSKTSQLYRHNFAIEDHQKLAEVLTRSKHKILISYDDCDFIRDLYQGWNIEKAEWTYCGTSSSEDATTKTKKKGKELLIRNYVN